MNDSILNWLYPDNILTLHDVENNVNERILGLMKSGSYNPNNESYRNRTAKKVKPEEALEDLAKSRLIIFGKNIRDPIHISSEKEIVNEIAKSPFIEANQVTVAPSIGDFKSMGELEGMLEEEFLHDTRLIPEVHEYLGALVERLGKKSSGIVISPDDKQGMNGLARQIIVEKRALHTERSRRVGESLGAYLKKSKLPESIYFFGSNLWTLPATLSTIAGYTGTQLRAFSQDPVRVDLAGIRNSESGFYRIEHPAGVIEYVLVGGIRAKEPIKVQSEARPDQLSLLKTALDTNAGLEQLERAGGAPEVIIIYRQIRGLQDELDRARKNEKPAVKPIQPVSGDLVAMMRSTLKSQHTRVREEANWYNNISLQGKLGDVVDILEAEAKPWESTEYHETHFKEYTTASETAKRLESLANADTSNIGINEVLKRCERVKKEYNDAKHAYEEKLQSAPRIREKASQRKTIPLYIGIGKAGTQIITPFASNSDKLNSSDYIARDVCDFLKKTAVATIGGLIDKTEEEQHELAGKPASIDRFVAEIFAQQQKQPWHLLGYRLDLTISSLYCETVQQTQLPQLPTEKASIQKGVNYTTYSEFYGKLAMEARKEGIDLPKEEQIRAVYTGQMLKEQTMINFGYVVWELARGSGETIGKLADIIAAKHGVSDAAIEQFIRITIMDKHNFPSVFQRREGNGPAAVELKPEYMPYVRVRRTTSY